VASSGERCPPVRQKKREKPVLFCPRYSGESLGRRSFIAPCGEAKRAHGTLAKRGATQLSQAREKTCRL